MIKIAHISDIHFGNGFSLATWNQVAKAVIGFDPQLIVVSGDLVDDPSPAHLLAAKCALDDLLKCARENSAALGSSHPPEMVVIPGNHDVFVTGLAAGAPRHRWFERMFYGADTAKAEEALRTKLNVKSLAFNSVCLGLAPDTRPQDAGFWQRAWVRVTGAFSSGSIAPWDKADDFAALLGQPLALPAVSAPASAPVLLALLDSNPGQQGYDAATGMVDNDQLMGLQSAIKEKLKEKKGAYVARIAVIHHHVLPVAFAANVDKMTGEPMMVLRNAGAVLRTLADHKFDLILHGHWHKPQFVRVDFGSDDRLSYPMAVASAGSAAKTSSDPKANSINLITIADSGRIEACSLYYGGSQPPMDPNDPNSVAGTHYNVYREPLSAAKRRAYVRARERHVIECSARKQFYEITENGDMWLTHRLEGLRIRDIPIYKRREHSMVIPRHGHFDVDTLDLDEGSKRAGVTLSLESPSADPDHKRRRYWVDLPNGGLKQGGSASYGVSYGCANSMLMTYWEAAERARLFPKDRAKEDVDSEWVGTRVSFPTEKLTLSIKQPPSLAALQPYVECRRYPGYPVYDINKWGDADLNAAKMPIDSEAQEEEQQHLSYDAPTSTWTLEIDRPIVGYQYALRWKLRDDAPDPATVSRARWQEWQRITGQTEGWRRALLNLGDRIDGTPTDAADAEAVKQFDLLCETLKLEVCQGGRAEKWTIALFVYDSDKLALRPVLSRHSWSNEQMPRTFEMPYGDGVGGAAFQQRRIIAWSQQPVTGNPARSARALITPLPYPAPSQGPADVVNVLALPVYHSGNEDDRRPSPSTAIGVVTISSSSYASPIRGMDDEQRLSLRAAAQTQMDHMVQAAMGLAP